MCVHTVLVTNPSSDAGDASVTNHSHKNSNITRYPSPSVSHSSRTPAPSDSEAESESFDFRMASFSPSNDPLLDAKLGGTHDDEEYSKHCGQSTNALHIAIVNSNDSSCEEEEEHSVSMSQCRYCYADTPRKDNVSQCLCNGTLCKECLIKELQLTFGRKDQLLQCTVCKVERECVYCTFYEYT